MKVPENGFSQPCCADCAEFNPRGCPGHSPFCVESPFVGLDFQARSIQRALDDMRPGLSQHVGGMTGHVDEAVGTVQDVREHIADAQIAASQRSQPGG